MAHGRYSLLVSSYLEDRSSWLEMTLFTYLCCHIRIEAEILDCPCSLLSEAVMIFEYLINFYLHVMLEDYFVARASNKNHQIAECRNQNAKS